MYIYQATKSDMTTETLCTIVSLSITYTLRCKCASYSQRHMYGFFLFSTFTRKFLLYRILYL